VKKAAVILLLFIYGSATMGATVHLHYCMNNFVGWSLLWHSNKGNECGKCGMKEKKGGCCKDEHKQLKLTTEHPKSPVAQSLQLLEAPVLVTPVPGFTLNVTTVSPAFPVSHAPPKISNQRLYILHCIFLI
jgi:hypothetical protein